MTLPKWEPKKPWPSPPIITDRSLRQELMEKCKKNTRFYIITGKHYRPTGQPLLNLFLKVFSDLGNATFTFVFRDK